MFTKELFNELNRQEIEYAVLRNYRQLPDSCGGSDLDIWVAEKDVIRVFTILDMVGEKTGNHLVSYTHDNHCPKICYLGLADGIQVDIFIGNIYCKGSAMFSEECIKSNICLYNGVKVLNEHFGNLLAFLKEIFNNGKCAEKYTLPLTANKDIYNADYIDKQLYNYSKDFKSLLEKVIAHESFSENNPKLAALGIACIGSKLNIRFFSQIAKYARVFNQPGYTIAVLGTDGSGKSFIINKITPILNEAFHKGVRYEHMRPNHLPSLAVALGKKKADEPAAVCSNPHGSKPSGFMGSLLRLSYYWIDYTWGYFRKVFADKAFRTHVWLFDRYYYDYYVDQRRARLSLPNWVIKLFGWFVPCPDLTICLGGDPAKIYARKPETSLEEVTRQTRVLKDFSCRHKRTVWVDTTVAPEESVEMAMKAIVEMMSKRFAK